MLLLNMSNKLTSRLQLYFIFILLFSLLVFWPSFKLALTGDDYLSLYRIQNINLENLNYFEKLRSIFLRDYGPQDTFVAIVHHFFGFYALPYYLISFIARFLAACSFYPLIKYITKNKFSAIFSVMFFSVTTTGLETTDWVFNAPSYFAIIFLNFFLLNYLKNDESKTISPKSVALYLLTIIIQPIRMLFLPGLIILKEIYSYVYSKTKKNYFTIKSIVVYLLVFVVLMFISDYGNTIGLSSDGVATTTGFWDSRLGKYFFGFKEMYDNQNYKYLLFPMGQLGSIFIPNNSIPSKFVFLTGIKMLLYVVVPLYFLFLLTIWKFKIEFKIKERVISIIALAGAFWLLSIWYLFSVNLIGHMHSHNIVSLMIGGLILPSLLIIHYS